MNGLSEVDLMPKRGLTMLPTNILYQISENDLEKLIIKAEEKAYERGQKKPFEKPLTREEAAAFLRIEPATLDRRIKSGVLPATLRHYNGGTIYFFASELENFIRKS